MLLLACLAACTPQVAPENPVKAVVSLEPHFSDLEQPTDLRFVPGGSGRALVTEQPGRVVLVGDGPKRTVFEMQTRCCGEQGLLSLAPHPDFVHNGLLFLYGSDVAGDTALSRVRLDPRTLEADPSSYRVLLVITQPGPTHNGGQLQFGPDGRLYLSTGDGEYRPSWLGALPFAQELGTPLGKLLRFTVDNAGNLSAPHDNPFVEVLEAKKTIWALGLRNPWRFSFDRDTGDLFVADVGETGFEEINAQPFAATKGANYGWPRAEGPNCRQTAGCAALTAPAVHYTHGAGCSVTGGYVYRGKKLPSLVGAYLYGDFCSGTVWAAERRGDGWRSRVLADTPYTLSSFAQDGAGEVYLLDYAGGTVYRLEPRN